MSPRYRKIDGWRQDRKFRDLGGRKLDGGGKDGKGCVLILVAAGLSASAAVGVVVGRWPS